MKTSDFVEAFVQAASEVLRPLPADAYAWSGSSNDPPATLRVKAAAGGFPIEMGCETYGVYPKVAGWHGGCWDVTVFLPAQLAEHTKEFLTSLLSPESFLEIHKSNGKPYKFVLHYRFDGKVVADEDGTKLFNWFGEKSVETLRNNWLPAK